MAACLLGPTLALGLGAARPMAAQANAVVTPSVGAVTKALTGRSDTSALAPQAVCPPSAPGVATCYAQALIDRTDARYVHPALRTPASPIRFFADKQNAAAAPNAFAPAASGAGEPQPGTPAYLQQAYDLTYLSQTQGANDTVAVVDAYDAPTAETDLAAYRAQFGLPACTTANGCFKKVNQTGQQGSYPPARSDWEVEISLDLDAVSALCPRCHIVLVEANTAYTSDLLSAQATAAALGAQQISDSWGAVQSSSPGGGFTFAGVATVAASGDSGYVGAGQSQYPAALAGVTAAGGTTLTPAGAGSARGYLETAWSGAGSGCDTTQTKPTWQAAGGCPGRAYGDLSADADPQTGIAVYDTGEGGWIVVGGTSEASPLIAAYYAVTSAQASSPVWAYQHAGLLNDPAAGSNGTCAPTMPYVCNAGAGYDGPTGVGSISGTVVAGGPGISGPGPVNTYAVSATRTTAQLQAGVYPNGSGTTWWVQYGPTTAYGEQTSVVDAGAGSAPVAAAATLSGLSAGTQYHYRLVAQNAYGTTYGYDVTLTTAPPAAPAISSPGAAVNGQTATLTAGINPGGAPSAYHFQYGTTIALGGSSATQTIAGDATAGVTATVSGLAAHTTYYYQLVATNAGGGAASPIMSFTTRSGGSGGPTAHAAAAASGTVILTSAALSGARATAAVTCRASSACRVRVRVVVGGRVLAGRSVTVPAHRTATVRFKLSRRSAAVARAHRGRIRVALVQLLRRGYRTVASKRVG